MYDILQLVKYKVELSKLDKKFVFNSYKKK